MSNTSKTEARITQNDASHWYTKDGQSVHFTLSKSTGNMRPTTLRDAKKHNYYPSVTSVQKIVAKPSLTSYLVEQACLAVLTAPLRPGESIDAHVKRVLKDERQQDEHKNAAAEMGTRIHADIEAGVTTQHTVGVLGWLESIGAVATQKEQVVTSPLGYAGTCDWIGTTANGATIIDWKTTSNLPNNGPWPEHEEQVAAYAATRNEWPSVTGYVCYISTSNPGEYIAHKIDSKRLVDCFEAFKHTLALWKHRNNYQPGSILS